MIAAALIFLLGSAAALCLASGMARHQRDLFGRTLPPRRSAAARVAGCILLAAAAILAVAARGWAVGMAVWLALAPLGALASVFLISYMSTRSQGR